MSGRARFIVPSAIGILVFLTPIAAEGEVNIGVGVATDFVAGLLGAQLPALVTLAVVLSALASLAAALTDTSGRALREGPARRLFLVGWPTVAVRFAGAGLAVMVLLQRGPEWVISAATGQVILNDLMTVIFVLFFFSALALPLLTDFGLMEFAGTLLRPVFRRLFTLPGRASIDALASWIGSAVVGTLITIDQYERGYYSAREASVIATSFSIVSIAFSVVIIGFVGLGEVFVPYYATVCVASLIAALILPRVPPLSRKPDDFCGDRYVEPAAPAGQGLLTQATELAVKRAAEAPPAGDLAKTGIFHVFDIWFGLEPLVMVIGTTALAVTEFTPVFDWLAMPIVPLLELLQLPEAAAAAPAFLVGFADQFLPAILGQGIESELTRFVIACMAITQLIYMSEVGALLLRSSLPLSLLDLFAIFVIRTIITLPVCVAAAYLIF